MSRENTPTDNAVAERFMRTFKEHQIDGKIIELAIQEAYIPYQKNETKTKGFKSIINKYINSLNKKPNKKSLEKSPETHDKDVRMASMLMVEPIYTKAFSNHYGYDFRREEINKFKTEYSKVNKFLEEIASKKAELVDTTPFDSREAEVIRQVINDRFNEIYQLLETNSYIVKECVEQVIEGSIQPLNENLDEIREDLKSEMKVLNKKLDMLLPKAKKDRQVQPLRDPIDNNLFPIFLNNAGQAHQRKQDLIRSQLRITYTILYYCGLRINEIRHLTQQDLQTAIEASQFNLIHHKTKEAHIHVLPRQAVKQFRELNKEFFIIFDKYQYNYLFGKSKPMTDKNLIKMVNKDLANTFLKYNVPFNIKSHSFRINTITNLLRVTSVQNTANIIGHADIRSTMTYNRYTLTKQEIQDLFDRIEFKN